MSILGLLDATTGNESESLLPYFIEAAFIYAGLIWFICWGFGINLKDKATQKAGLVVLVLSILPSYFVFGFIWSFLRSTEMLPLPKYSQTSKNDNRASSEQPSITSNSQTSKSSASTNSSSSNSQSDSLYSEIDNQMSVRELRERLDEVKAIEREARGMLILRRNWEERVSECMRIMERLKPRAAAIRDEYKRMLSPAGMDIASAAMNLVGCINCVENDDDDCSYARDFINKAERELKKEMRENRR